MKKLLISVVVLMAMGLSASAQFAPETKEPNQPLILSVFSAQRYNNRGMTMTNAIATLSDNPGVRLHMVCDVGIFSIGPDGQGGNQYPARHSKTGQIKIQSHEMGSDRVREHTCKY